MERLSYIPLFGALLITQSIPSKQKYDKIGICYEEEFSELVCEADDEIVLCIKNISSGHCKHSWIDNSYPTLIRLFLSVISTISGLVIIIYLYLLFIKNNKFIIDNIHLEKCKYVDSFNCMLIILKNYIFILYIK